MPDPTYTCKECGFSTTPEAAPGNPSVDGEYRSLCPFEQVDGDDGVRETPNTSQRPPECKY